MKKVLSITLTLAMLLGSFLMLVPAVSATEGDAAAAPTGGVYYANDFDDVTATTREGILASIGWKAEEALKSDTTIAVEDGRLVMNVPKGADHGQESFIVIENNEALKNGYVVDFDVEMISNTLADGTAVAGSGTNSDAAVSVHSATAPVKADNTLDWTRNGRHGWIGQIRWNTNVLAGAEGGSSWKPAVNGTPQAAKDTYLKKADDSVATTMQNIRVSVRVAYDATAMTVKTYVKAYAPGVTFSEADVMQTATISDASTVNMLTDDFRFVIYDGLKVAIDNVRVGTADALAAADKDMIYSQNFDVITGADTTAILTALGWRTEQEWAEDSESSVAVVDGRLVIDAVSDQEELVVLENVAKLLEGYVIECDIEILSNQVADAENGGMKNGPQDNAVGFVSSLSPDFSLRAGRQGWWSQVRAYAGLLAGSEDGTGWKNVSNQTKRPWFVAMAPEGTDASQLAINNRIFWRAEFDKDNAVIKTFAKPYAEGKVSWGADDLQAESQQADYLTLLTDDLRFIAYKGMKVAIDNLQVYKPVPVTIPVNGEATEVTYGAMDLADYVDGTFAFAIINGTQVVTNAAYTMDEFVTSIDVYALGVSALKGASIRATDAAALRFRTAIAKADYDALVAAKAAGVIKNFEVGTLTIDYATLGALGQLKLDTEGATKVVAAAADVTAYGESDYAVNCVIEVAADKLNTKYAAAGYAIVEFNDGTKLELTAKYDKYTMVRSVAEIAQTITFDEAHGLSADQLAKVNAFAAKYVAE